MRNRALPWLVLLLLAGLAFGLACRLVPPPAAGSGADPSASTAGRLLSAGRTGLGAGAIRQADLYLHKGMDRAPAEGFTGTWFQRMGSLVSLHGVAHREGKDAGEVVPWLWFGTALDPDNLEYSLMSAYWLRTAGRDDLAMEVVRNSLGRYPRDPGLHLERARLFLRAGRFRDAAMALDAGIVCAGRDTRQNAADTLRALTTYRGLLYEHDGNTSAAIAVYAAGQGLSPDLCDRAADLRGGRTPAVPAAALLKNLVSAKHRCEHHEHTDGGEHEDDHAR